MSSFLEDARRFVLTNRYIADLAPLQIYSSAVVFAPQNSVVKGTCGRIPVWIRRSPITPAMWGPELQKLEGHTDGVTAVAFTQDGSLLASASWDMTVRLWDPVTGQETRKLKGHTNKVNAVAFTQDGSLLASASWDKTVRLWDPVTGQQVQRLHGMSYFTDMEFAIKNNTLITNQGTFNINHLSNSIPVSFTDINGFLSLKNDWIQQTGRNLLWLPHEYRSDVSVCYGNTIVIGQSSGQVSFIQLDHSRVV